MTRRHRVLTTAVTLLSLGASATVTSGAASAQRFWIDGATVIDGSGAPARAGAVAVRDGRIEAIGELRADPGETVVDAQGLVLAPGFIDTHSHHDWGLFEMPDALGAVSQGITTIVVGQDGGSNFPLADFFSRLEESPVALNVASYAGHNTLRRLVMGEDFRRQATPAEVEHMRALLAVELRAGALGLATGLEYDPGIYSHTGEVIALAREAASAGGRYISHMRSEDRDFFAAVDELIAIGREASLPVQISHIKLAMRVLDGARVIALIASASSRARGEGVEVTADIYPYTYWQSTMQVLYPERNFDSREETDFILEQLVAPEDLLVGDYEAEPELAGKTLAEIADERGQEPAVTLMQLIAESRAANAGESIIATSMTETDIDVLMAWAHTNICSDGGLDGAHPRGFGAYPRVLGHYVRGREALTLEQAIHKMTALAAENTGILGRGRLEVGAAADLVLFDPVRIVDRATAEEPHLTAVGIERVWVNGVEVYRGGATTGERPGRVVRRGGR